MHLNPARHYRSQRQHNADEQMFQVIVEETDLWISVPAAADRERMIDEALRQSTESRGVLRAWMAVDPAFRHSLTALPVPEQAPGIVRAMYMAAERMGVGPFAAVAGAVAEAVARSLVNLLQEMGVAPEVMVENGGDSYIFSRRDRVVALLPYPEEEANLGLLIPARDFPLSLCASSSTIGHSLSFGQGDLAVVRARDGALADAAATAYGNMLKGEDGLRRTLKRAEQDARLGVEGVFAQFGGQVGVWGAMELTAV